MDGSTDVLPEDADRATLVARVFDPEVGGPCVAAVRGSDVVDLTERVPTVADLLDETDPVAIVRHAPGGQRWPLAELVEHTLAGRTDRPHLLAPCDLQVIRACGVTFSSSLLERVIEEQARGNPALAAGIRQRLVDVVGESLRGVRPGSPEAARVKELLVAEGLWSQYLEVGLGPDPEVFTKAPVLASVGLGAPIGVRRGSTWNNPEPEVVLAVNAAGAVRGATLGNDVNLRDVEGRSALLLPMAKDNNASCAIGPLLRLRDDTFGLADIRQLTVSLTVTGRDGFVLTGSSSMREISRDPLDLVAHTVGADHQYPDGIFLFTGTLFAPTQDRDGAGEGFTHHEGDVVRISSPRLGTLQNEVTFCDQAPPWTTGLRAFMRNLAARGLLRER
ncbi:fumarylacetoacetate hydrolase family protein [Goodfellowiella coeruleoviolacea]|uniref:Fumarylacetoacetate (FAA) hydrolase family protein n=1 Tax=Goodfellowiella coeruleoviolacea TaxID=334858 RepID=A0AAE3G8M0_9PSEU|nr:fumarylacetoacetate hydrolase family protein [Goodfellowiella coeruleoviolacea]MCP2163721.1 Fumarylacetoacetate (FAA) hydrolase family protein [Goodfellowiella coeruleoviolacea]